MVEENIKLHLIQITQDLEAAEMAATEIHHKEFHKQEMDKPTPVVGAAGPEVETQDHIPLEDGKEAKVVQVLLS